jgi:hypothetical protein
MIVGLKLWQIIQPGKVPDRCGNRTRVLRFDVQRSTNYNNYTSFDVIASAKLQISAISITT